MSWTDFEHDAKGIDRAGRSASSDMIVLGLSRDQGNGDLGFWGKIGMEFAGEIRGSERVAFV